MKKKEHVIAKIEAGSIAEEMGLAPKDKLLEIDHTPIEDIFDYQFLIQDEYLEVLIEKPDGEQWLLEIDKEFDEDLGIEFENGLMDEYRSCHNKCIFCFIDQMPKGMRDTLYFKDDDSRLSFLQGNYVTLTNMSEHDIDRIIRYHLSPINISFQTTNPKLRCKMLNNRFAGEALQKVDRLFAAGITMNGQIVLCKGVNDGEELERSIRDLTAYLPCLESVSVVPVGLSKYRDGLYPLEAFTKEDAKEVLARIHGWQNRLYPEYGLHFIHASDEWYILAEEELPEAERYDGYLQLENGVGMLRLLLDEFEEGMQELTRESKREEDRKQENRREEDRKRGNRQEEDQEPENRQEEDQEPENRQEEDWKQENRQEERKLENRRKEDQEPENRQQEEGRQGDRTCEWRAVRTVSLATGLLAYPYIKTMTERMQETFPGLTIHLYPIVNEFFGEKITVSGLLTGQDIKKQLQGKTLGERLLLPQNVLRSGEDVFLDDVTLPELEKALQVPIDIVKSSGRDFILAILGDKP